MATSLADDFSQNVYVFAARL